MNNKNKNLAHIVRQARKECGLSQEKLAEILNIDQRTILNIESGHGNPKFEKLFAIVFYLKIPGDCIFYPGCENLSPKHQKLFTLLKTCSEQEIGDLLPIINALVDLSQKNKNTVS